MEIATFDLEKKLLGKGYGFVIGVDEAGRGPLVGPVVACAATLKNNESGIKNQELKEWDLVRDSKKLSAGQREKAFDFVLENFHVGIGICDHETIDRVNILEASFLAMKIALVDLNSKLKNYKLNKNSKFKIQNYKQILLVDGNKKIPNFSGEQLAVVGGDKIVKSISAASIVAKVTRDRMMMEAHEKYPQYHFDKHKGYGTKIHMESLKQYGPCEIHRKSFAPVKKTLK
ncbi:MAG: Ribonuclease HII [Candidatus Moranbacteria bacterium GW2011_GWE2_35_2-]|nr:MAG: Ribonuclease HII [Candidatus Moranbacteria bacterium GW2011_GWE2_35_2-]KKQ22111.1 MAG: Ribonuclease HII [Candidatus Moranbacteria bacterium GW2011_GWF2_37_11]KKQ29137.1 MAG: Ribonuclease HII [Candidatus Moranbacteria bacterium GW2011_GWD1_37_17]KKQ31122.1 MAG: Ribonuclease HII [Candidatus Moranbacteria bacterium GW2011_GWE1_37_24]HBO16480.1 ribonuclease HII [Candidatus Moranbacteria bacterium]